MPDALRDKRVCSTSKGSSPRI